MPHTNRLTAAQWAVLRDPTHQIAHLCPPVSERKLRLFGCYCCRRLWDSLSPEGRNALDIAERFAEGLASDAERQTAFRRLVETSGGYVGPHPAGRPWRTATLSTDLFAFALTLVIANGETLVSRESGHEIGATYEDMTQISHIAGCCQTVQWLAVYQAQRQQDATRGPVGRAWNRLVRGVTRGIDRSVTRRIDRVWGTAPAEEAREQEIKYQAPLVHDIFGNPFVPVAFSANWRTDTVLLLAKQMYEARDFSAMPILADALQDAGCDSEAVLTHCRDVKQVHVRGCWVLDLVLQKERSAESAD
jgi:hypothetical protein